MITNKLEAEQILYRKGEEKMREKSLKFIRENRGMTITDKLIRRAEEEL